MSSFEKITKIDDSLNGHASREKVFRIEKADEDYRIVASPERVEQFDKIVERIEKNAKNQSKSPKRRLIKDPAKRNQKPMAPVQEQLEKGPSLE